MHVIDFDRLLGEHQSTSWKKHEEEVINIRCYHFCSPSIQLAFSFEANKTNWAVNLTWLNLDAFKSMILKLGFHKMNMQMLDIGASDVCLTQSRLTHSNSFFSAVANSSDPITTSYVTSLDGANPTTHWEKHFWTTRK